MTDYSEMTDKQLMEVDYSRLSKASRKALIKAVSKRPAVRKKYVQELMDEIIPRLKMV